MTTIQTLIQKRLPQRFLHAKISDIHLSILKQLKTFKENGSCSKGMYIHGTAGSGKTHTACAIGKQLLSNNYDVHFYSFPKMLLSIRNSYKKEVPSKYDIENNTSSFVDTATIEKFIDAEILIIDDIGKEKITAWVSEALYLIINSRYENESTTIFTSNFDLNELSDRLGDSSMTSRIREMCQIYKLSSSDKRNSSIEETCESVDIAEEVIPLKINTESFKFQVAVKRKVIMGGPSNVIFDGDYAIIRLATKRELLSILGNLKHRNMQTFDLSHNTIESDDIVKYVESEDSKCQ